jgi:hypothetical protein
MATAISGLNVSAFFDAPCRTHQKKGMLVSQHSPEVEKMKKLFVYIHIYRQILVKL